MKFFKSVSISKQAPIHSSARSGSRPSIRALVKLLMLGAALSTTATAQAYFITPYAQLNADVSNGFIENGPTSGSASIGPNVTAQVDLAAGETRNYVQVGSGQFGQSAGVMGDRFTLSGGASVVDFIFNFDGTISTDAASNGVNSLQIGVTANLRVFDASAGATNLNFAGLAGALVSDTRSLNFNDPTASLNAMVDEALSGSFDFLGGSRSIDVFASLSIFSAVNNNDVNVVMNFLNTGTFGIEASPGTSFSSASGVFPGSIPPVAGVPEPSVYGLLSLGLIALAGASRRRRTNTRQA